MSDSPTAAEKLLALRRMYGARPVQLSAAALVGLGTALLGGAGLAFLIPIIEFVRQRPFLFDDTIRNNIVLQHQTADEQRFERACDTAMIEDFVGEMPSGYATEIGENGVKLSGGQRQRVAMARALYADRDVLVLDEATSELDYDIRRDIEEGVAEWQCSRILVVIGHQLSSIRRSDTIYLLGDGEITERGTHDRLRDRSEAYEALFQ